jgi:hypothetical protein
MAGVEKCDEEDDTATGIERFGADCDFSDVCSR